MMLALAAFCCTWRGTRLLPPKACDHEDQCGLKPMVLTYKDTGDNTQSYPVKQRYLDELNDRTHLSEDAIQAIILSCIWNDGIAVGYRVPSCFLQLEEPANGEPTQSQF